MHYEVFGLGIEELKSVHIVVLGTLVFMGCVGDLYLDGMIAMNEMN